MLARLFAAAGSGEKIAELVMAVGKLGTHGQHFSECNRVAEMSFLFARGAVVSNVLDRAEEAIGHYLKVKIVMALREVQRLPGMLCGFGPRAASLGGITEKGLCLRL